MMMVDVTRRVSQWDQHRIMSAVESGTEKTQIIGGHRHSTMPSSRAVSVADNEEHRPSTTRVSTAADVSAKPSAADGALGASLSVPDHGRLRPLVFSLVR